MNTNTSKLLAAACRWVARIFGTLLVMVVVWIAVGNGLPNPLTQPVLVQIGFLALAIIVSGILAGWRWELSGGMMSLFGWCLFLSAVILPKSPTWFVTFLALPGVGYVTSALLRHYYEKRPSA
jgi:hypothetical protein